MNNIRDTFKAVSSTPGTLSLALLLSIETANEEPVTPHECYHICHIVTGNMDLLQASPSQVVNIPRSYERITLRAQMWHTYWLQTGLLMGCLYINN